MPTLEPKAIQSELTQGFLWPVYWLHGGESMKARELTKRIRSTVGASSLNEEVLDAENVEEADILDRAQSLALGGGTRMLVIQNAHALSEPGLLEPLLGPRAKLKDLSSVCVFVSKDLDQRRKFTKTLLQKAAVVPVTEVPESERPAWIDYLAKRRSIKLSEASLTQLRAMDPWSLDLMDQELSKLEIFNGTLQEQVQILSGDGSDQLDRFGFIEDFMMRRHDRVLAQLKLFASDPDIALPLVGLLAWNLRQLWMGLQGQRPTSYFQNQFDRWKRVWNLHELQFVQEGLSQLDYDLKQSGLHPLGLWTQFITDGKYRD